jgi:CubicO group peptidase (beta-lactamase class C family)
VSVDDARRAIADAIAARTFPAASIEVGGGESAIWSEALGTLTFDPASLPTVVQTPFDLASLTKVIATTTIVMELVRAGGLRLDERVSDVFGDWRGADRETVTVRDLLEHASGLPARLVDQPPATRREFEHDISTIALDYTPRTQSIYSDLGFILLGFLAADRGGASLAAQFDAIARDPRSVRLQPDRDFDGDPPHSDLIAFDLPPGARSLTAPTMPEPDDLRRGRMLVGEVHDNYAAALGGVAGHAGLFGTAPAVGAFARTLLRASRGDTHMPPPFSPAAVAEFSARGSVPGSSRALGWDTMLPTSSCGTRMLTAAFGHVGFTGTSLWIDPLRDRYFVLLTNRACGGGTLDQMRTVRRAFHDALGDV